MKITATIQGSNNSIEKELNRIDKLKHQLYGPVSTLGGQAVTELSSLTPSDTGKTASSWNSLTDITDKGLELSITNDSLTSSGIPIVVLLRHGHGTGTGGYVPPNDFISPVEEQLVDNISKLIDGKLR